MAAQLYFTQAFPTTISSLATPRSVSPQPTAALALRLLHNPPSPAPIHCPFQGTSVPVQRMYGRVKDCLILVPCRLPQISCFTLSHFVSPLTQTIAPRGDGTPASVPPPAEGRSSPTNTRAFPPGSFILPSFAWVYRFFSAGRVLLSTLSWCSACTSVSEGVVLMYPQRDVLHVHLLLHRLVLLSLFFFFLPHYKVCGILGPNQGLKLGPDCRSVES